MKKNKMPFVVIKCNSPALSRMVLALLKDFGCDTSLLDSLIKTHLNLGTVGNFSTTGGEINSYSDGSEWYYNYQWNYPYCGAVKFDASTQMGELIEFLTNAGKYPKLEVLLNKDYTATVEGDGTKIKVGCQEFSTASVKELMDKIDETFPLWNL